MVPTGLKGSTSQACMQTWAVWFSAAFFSFQAKGLYFLVGNEGKLYSLCTPVDLKVKSRERRRMRQSYNSNLGCSLQSDITYLNLRYQFCLACAVQTFAVHQMSRAQVANFYPGMLEDLCYVRLMVSLQRSPVVQMYTKSWKIQAAMFSEFISH